MIRLILLGVVIAGTTLWGAPSVEAQQPYMGRYGYEPQYGGGYRSMPHSGYNRVPERQVYPSYTPNVVPRQSHTHHHHEHNAYRPAPRYPQVPPSSYPNSHFGGWGNSNKHTGEYPDHPWHLGHYLFHH